MFLRNLCRLCCSSILSSRLSSSLCSCSSVLSSHPPFRKILPTPNFTPSRKSPSSSFSLSSQLYLEIPEKAWLCIKARNFSISHGTLSLVISPEGQPKFETHEIEPPKKEKWQTKKRLKLQRKREKQKRKAANKRDPRRLSGGKTKRQRFATAEERIKYKLERARIKEGLLIERLKKYEVPKAQGPVVEPHTLTGEERFYMKKMAQKRSNYVPVGRRGIFGGVILNMHLHWKKHETVKVICKPCKPGQVQEFADEIARLSGGVPIQIIGDDTIVFYRGKNYVQPKVMSPVDTLSKKRALEKSKYEQSLESVRRFIAIGEKELELYYRHVALYGDPNDRDPKSILDKSGPTNNKTFASSKHNIETDFVDHEISELEDDDKKSSRELDHKGDDFLSEDNVSSDEDVMNLSSASGGLRSLAVNNRGVRNKPLPSSSSKIWRHHHQHQPQHQRSETTSLNSSIPDHRTSPSSTSNAAADYNSKYGFGNDAHEVPSGPNPESN